MVPLCLESGRILAPFSFLFAEQAKIRVNMALGEYLSSSWRGTWRLALSFHMCYKSEVSYGLGKSCGGAVSDLQEWLRNHEPLWKHRQPRTEQALVPRPLFGEEDAVTEWQHSLNPQQIFAPISSYEEFRSQGALFLFGRRGTGKTAILHMLKHSVNTGGAASGYYSRAVLVQPAVKDLLPVLKGARLAELEDNELLSLLRLAWLWLIVSAAYLEIARTHPEHREHGSELAIKINRALDAGLIDDDVSEYLLAEMLSIFKAAFLEVPEGSNQLALTIIALRENFGNLAVKPLELKVTSFSRHAKQPVLILVETEEVYEVDDKFASAVRSALIDAVLDLYNRSQRIGILAKAAFPSEIYPFLAPSNLEKVETKNVFILWRYRDLVTLVAKRFYRMLHKDRRTDKLENELKSFEDFAHARKYLRSIFPPRIATRNDVDLDTFSYILRHTQKKPRQLITIFNCILTMAADSKKSFGDLGGAADLIREAVHSHLGSLVNGALDIYRDIFPRAHEIVRKALTGMPCYFSAPDLDKAIKETNELRGQVIGREEVRQLLLQAGVVGLARKAPHSIRKQEPSASLMEALFEYQIKAQLIVTNNSICVVHPMFYEVLEIKIDSTVLAYPTPTEEEIELLRELGLLR
jgi:hypothetical protein